MYTCAITSPVGGCRTSATVVTYPHFVLRVALSDRSAHVPHFPPMSLRLTPWHLFGGAVLYGATTFGFYSYLGAHKLPGEGEEGNEGVAEAGRPSAATYDMIARKYDGAVGSEEFSMGTPLLRKW